MAAPISNNNQIVIDQKKAGNANNGNPEDGNKAAATNIETAAARQDDAINVSNAARALGNSDATHSTGTVANNEQAAELAQKIAQFFTEHGAKALTAHDNSNAKLATLLKTG